ncbi:MAG TPA: hypothetical protein VNF93_02270 [Buchnera sp. (in: enterobacteria)]|nr:hypothetical protein [Buchnera sp. (in: enterobacteria)]
MGNPTLLTGYGSFYYLCDRDPTSTELDVLDPTNLGVGVYVNIPDFKYSWFNTITGDLWWCIDNTFNSMIWKKEINDINFNNFIPINLKNSQLNTSRSYSIVNSPSFSTVYTPSLTNDTHIIATIGLTSVIAGSASATLQIDSGSGYNTIATISLSGIAATIDNTLNSIIPLGSSYKILSSISGLGSSVSFVSLQQLNL